MPQDTDGFDPAIFGEPPAREERFTVVEQWADCVNLPDDHPDREIEFFHRQMNEELNVLENCARSLVMFPDAPWNIRKGLARQGADEARHTATYLRLLTERGGHVGQFPVMNFQFRILEKIDHLEGRFAVQNRTFEADGLDAVTHALARAQDKGDEELVEIYEVQQADEVLHVRYALEWIRKRIQEQPQLVLRIVRAVNQALEGLAWVVGRGGGDVDKYGIAVPERLEAGFTREEAELADRKNEERRAAIRAAQAASNTT